MSSNRQKPSRQPQSKKQPTPIQQPPDPTANLNPKQKISYFLTNIQQKIIHEIDEHKQPVSLAESPFFQDEHAKAIKKNQEKLKKLTEQRKLTENRYKELAEKEFELKRQYKARLKQNFYESRKLNDSRSNQSRDHLKNSRLLNNKTQRLKDSTHKVSSQNQFLNDFQQPPMQSSSLKTLPAITYNLLPKSQLTPQDVKTLKSLKQQYHKFEQELSLKTIKHNQELQKIRKENIQFQEIMKKQKNQKKRKEIELKLQDLERLKQERIKKYEEQRVRMMEIKKRPKRFQKLMKEFQDKEKMFEQRKVQQMKIRLKNKVLDISEITEHQKRYQELREQHLRQLQQKYLQNTKILKQSRFQPEHKSRFYKSVIEEQRERKLSKKKKELATIEKCQRIKEYSQKVYEQYAPRLKTRENQQEDDQTRKEDVKQDRSLSVEDRQRLGNDYLKQVIKQLKKQQQQKQKLNNKQGGKDSSLSFHSNTSKSSNLPPISSLSTKYKDYLAEQRTKQASPQLYEQYKQKRAKQKYINSIEQVKKIMSQDMTKKKRYQTIDKIKEITERLQHGTGQADYIDKIRAKISILQTIT